MGDAPAWRITRAAVLDARVVNLTAKGLPPVAATRRKINYFQPVNLVLEYERGLTGEWELRRVEATGPICQPDGGPGPDPDDTHIYAWVTPLRPTRANPDGVPDWVIALGQQYMPHDRDDEK